jgi:hypothetical protein
MKWCVFIIKIGSRWSEHMDSNGDWATYQLGEVRLLNTHLVVLEMVTTLSPLRVVFRILKG